MLLALSVLVVSLSLILAVGSGVTYARLTQAHAWAFIAAHGFELGIAIAVTTISTLVNLWLRWLRWTFLLRRFHARIPTRETFRLFFVNMAIVTPFYLGETLRGLVVARRYGVPKTAVVSVWVVERCSDVAALLILLGIATSSPIMAAIGVAALLLGPWLLARLTLRLPGANRQHTGQLAAGSSMCMCAVASLLAWLLPAASLVATLGFLGRPASTGLAVEVFASGTLLGGVSGSPGGLGTTGSTMIAGLTDAGFSLELASTAILAHRFATQWFAVALALVLAFVWRRALMAQLRATGAVQQHFDSLAPSYAQDIPEHYRQEMLERKIDSMLSALPTPGSDVRGLDLGCGHGWYACELARRGYAMHGIDLSAGQVREAERHCEAQRCDVTLTTYDGLHLPYPDGYFDFAYSINVLHHVPNAELQRELMAEVLRVLKPSGRFLLHEMNVENAVFRGYVSYIFPLLKSIDEGTELWIRPSQLPGIPGGRWQRAIKYFTFAPEFLPKAILRLVRPVERWLEGSRFRKYSAHYMAVLTHDADTTIAPRAGRNWVRQDS